MLLLVAATDRELCGHDGLVCGVGPVEAAVATARALALRSFDAVVHVGLAGARGVPVGSLVVGTEAVYCDLEAEWPVVDRAAPDERLVRALDLFGIGGREQWVAAGDEGTQPVRPGVENRRGEAVRTDGQRIALWRNGAGDGRQIQPAGPRVVHEVAAAAGDADRHAAAGDANPHRNGDNVRHRDTYQHGDTERRDVHRRGALSVEKLR